MINADISAVGFLGEDVGFLLLTSRLGVRARRRYFVAGDASTTSVYYANDVCQTMSTEGDSRARFYRLSADDFSNPINRIVVIYAGK